MRAMTALWLRVASWAARPVWLGPAHPTRRRTESTYSSGSSDKPRVSSPEALAQTVLNARVNAGGDDALDFHALACKVIVAVSIERGGRAARREWAGRAWRLRFQRGRCATRAHVQLAPRQAEQQGSGSG